MKSTRPCLLMILDGWGRGESDGCNAVLNSNTPNLDFYEANYPAAVLGCSGGAVGLPEGVMGNSEVGHINIGAGRVVYQDLVKIDRAIEDKSFFANKSIKKAFDLAKEKGTRLHFFGLLSDGKVHSSLDHLYALCDMAENEGVKAVVHPIMDGRDTAPDSGISFIKELKKKIEANSFVSIGSVCGRFYAMDRDKRWERIEKAYNLYTSGEGLVFDDAEEAVVSFYEREITDEFMEPALIGKREESILKDGDGVIFYNFRADRAREITTALTSEIFSFFNRNKVVDLSSYVCMTRYDEKFDLDVAYPPETPKDNLGEVLSKSGVKQLRIAETEKYAHVTYFFNGGVEEPFEGEDRVLVPSPRDVETYDEKPEMSAELVASTFLEKTAENSYGFMALNFANMDMVGHTGNYAAAVKACESVDRCLKPVVDSVLNQGGVVLITADHGNAEKMCDKDGNIYTAHTTNPVKIIMVDESNKYKLKKSGILGDIAPTVLSLMGLDIPEEMTGTSLLDL